MILFFYGWPKKVQNSFSFYDKVIKTYNAKVVAHFWHDQSLQDSLIRSDREDRVDYKNIEKFIELYNPEYLLISKPEIHETLYSNKDYNFAVPNYLSQLSSVFKSCSLIKTEDSLLIKARTDVIYEDSLPNIYDIKPNDIYIGRESVEKGISDIFAIGGSNSKKCFTHLYDLALKKASNKNEFRPEEILEECCKIHNLQVSRLNGEARILK